MNLGHRDCVINLRYWWVKFLTTMVHPGASRSGKLVYAKNRNVSGLESFIGSMFGGWSANSRDGAYTDVIKHTSNHVSLLGDQSRDASFHDDNDPSVVRFVDATVVRLFHSSLIRTVVVTKTGCFLGDELDWAGVGALMDLHSNATTIISINNHWTRNFLSILASLSFLDRFGAIFD